MKFVYLIIHEYQYSVDGYDIKGVWDNLKAAKNWVKKECPEHKQMNSNENGYMHKIEFTMGIDYSYIFIEKFELKG